MTLTCPPPSRDISQSDTSEDDKVRTKMLTPAMVPVECLPSDSRISHHRTVECIKASSDLRTQPPSVWGNKNEGGRHITLDDSLVSRYDSHLLFTKFKGSIVNTFYKQGFIMLGNGLKH